MVTLQMTSHDPVTS